MATSMSGRSRWGRTRHKRFARSCEAESYPGPSLILAYSHCIAHGINMATSMTHQKDAVNSGFWPLYRYDPRDADAAQPSFHLDSHKPRIRFRDFAMQEARFAMLMRSNPEHAERLLALAQRDIDDQWHYYDQLSRSGNDKLSVFLKLRPTHEAVLKVMNAP